MTASASRPEIELAVKLLQLDTGVVVIPTDTVYGIICRLDRPEAMERIYQIKGRDRSKPLVILGSEPLELLSWAAGDLTLPMALSQRFWPGPLTIVVKASERVPGPVLAGDMTVALRVPAHGAVRDLLSRLPWRCAASTSANVSGAGSPVSVQDVLESVGESVDYLMPDCGQTPAGDASTVIDVSGDRPVVLREGCLASSQILAVVSEVKSGKIG